MKILLFVFFLTSIFQVVGVASIFPFINLVLDPSVIETNNLLGTLFAILGFNSVNTFIVFIGLAMFVLIVLSNTISALTIWIKTRYVMGLNHSLAKRLLTIYLSKPYVFYLNRNTSDMGTYILSEVNQLTGKMLMPLFELVINGFMILMIVIFLLFTDFFTTLVAFSILGGSYGIINSIVKKRIKLAGTERVNANRGRFKSTGEALSGIKTTKVLGREKYFIEMFSLYSKKFIQVESFVKVASEIPKFILETIAFGGIILLVVFLSLTKNNAVEIIPLVSLFAFAGYRLMPAMQKVYQSLANIQFSQAILDSLHEEMVQQNTQETLDWENSITPLPFQDAIKLEGISFSYNRTEIPTLSGINLVIPANGSIGIVGSTGSGKTTLIDIIMGLLEPSLGTFFVDGNKIDKTNIRSWQANIGYVPQEIFLADDSIANNIGFGLSDRELDMKKVKEASRIAALDNFIMEELPEKYDTFVGERGVRLSGGQRQRIGLARALYNNPKILVLDEATSSLDGSTETAVIEAIKNASKDRTMIMIAHRLGTVKDCDVIYLLEDGKISDSGTYEYLLMHNLNFKNMAKIN